MGQKLSSNFFSISPGAAKGGERMSPSERRQTILEVLCLRRYDTYANLAFEFHVSKKTISRDITILMRDHPLKTFRGYGGGVRVEDGYYLYRGSLTDKEASLLKRMMDWLTGEDRNTIKNILRRFAPWYLSPAP